MCFVCVCVCSSFIKGSYDGWSLLLSLRVIFCVKQISLSQHARDFICLFFIIFTWCYTYRLLSVFFNRENNYGRSFFVPFLSEFNYIIKVNWMQFHSFLSSYVNSSADFSRKTVHRGAFKRSFFCA